jgi:hypothetical protein
MSKRKRESFNGIAPRHREVDEVVSVRVGDIRFTPAIELRFDNPVDPTLSVLTKIIDVVEHELASHLPAVLNAETPELFHVGPDA